jgi:hypothetical protein
MYVRRGQEAEVRSQESGVRRQEAGGGMSEDTSVFEKTYEYYLSAIRKLDFAHLADRLGGRLEDGMLKVCLFQEEYSVSGQAITDANGMRPGHDVCVILSRYLIMCPSRVSSQRDWANYRDLKDSGPLTVYFANEVEGAVEKRFSGRSAQLQAAGRRLGGAPPELSLDYDLALQFIALPRVPALLLFNDADEEFPAKCSVLFESRIEQFLDAECIAMLGWQLFHRLRSLAEG